MNDINYYRKYEPIDGKWYLEKQLGQGAYGTVFQVVRKDFGEQRAALKMVSIPSSQSEFDSFRHEHYELDEKSITSYFYGFVEEFVKEFQLMATLKGHSNIVSYEDHDVKAKEGEFGWDIFIRMELLTPLTDYLKEHTPTEADIIKIGIDICKALEVCKKHNIIHRDIKPANIFISSDGNFKLGDFGVARTLEKTASGLSKKGTYIYMAPEVYKGESYNLTVDLYSLGILMYRQLNDNFEPFRSDLSYSDGEHAMERRMHGERLAPPKNASPALAKIILKACGFSASERFQSPTDMRHALEALLKVQNSPSTAASQGGARMSVAPPPPVVENKRFCTSCGTAYVSGQTFCTNCNAPLSAAAIAQMTGEREFSMRPTPPGDIAVYDGTAEAASQNSDANRGVTSSEKVRNTEKYNRKVKTPEAKKPKSQAKIRAVAAILLTVIAVALCVPTLEFVIPTLGGSDIQYQDFLFCADLIICAAALVLISAFLLLCRKRKLCLLLIIAVILSAVTSVIGVNLYFSYLIGNFAGF